MANKSTKMSPEEEEKARIERLENRRKAFDKLIKKVDADFVSNSDLLNKDEMMIGRIGEDSRKVPTVSTGSLVVDYVLGGGFGRGRVVEVYGPEASGKTSVSMIAAGNIQKRGGNAVLLDLEHAFNPEYAEKLGVDLNELRVGHPVTAEETLDMIERLTESNVVDIIVVDSVSAMVPREVYNKSADERSMARLAQLMSSRIPLIVQKASHSGTIVVFINQLRSTMSPYGNPETTSGGKALAYFASQRVNIRRIEKIKDVGTKVKVKGEKNKVGQPYLEGETILTFESGLSVPQEIITTAPNYGVIERPTNRKYVYVRTGELIGDSKPNALERLENDPELVKQIGDDLIAVMSGKLTLADIAPQMDDAQEDGGENDSEVIDDILGDTETTGETTGAEDADSSSDSADGDNDAESAA